MLLHGCEKYHVLLALAGKIRIILHATVAIPLRKPAEVFGQPAGLLSSDIAVLPQLRQVFAKMEVNILVVASKARLELSVGISAPQPPGAYDLAGPPNPCVSL
jgi:hypothetical protein